MRVTIIVTAVALAVGAAGGAFGVYGVLSDRIDALADQRNAARREVEAARADARRHSDRVAYLESELGVLREQFESVAARPVSPLASMLEAEGLLDEPDAGEEAFPAAALSATPDAEDDSAAAPDRDRGGNWWNDPEQRRGRVQEFQSRLTERVDTFLDEAMAAAQSLAEQERITALKEHYDYLSALGLAMAEAETAEDRRALRGDLRQTFENLRYLMEEQQDAMIRTVAERYGVDDPADQRAFMDEVRLLDESPFFRPERLMMGDLGAFFGRRGR